MPRELTAHEHTGFQPVLGFTSATTCLKVQSRVEDSTTDVDIKPIISLVNNGPAAVPLSELKVRYWYLHDELPAVVDVASCMAAQNAVDCSQVDPITIVTPSSPNPGELTAQEHRGGTNPRADLLRVLEQRRLGSSFEHGGKFNPLEGIG